MRLYTAVFILLTAASCVFAAPMPEVTPLLLLLLPSVEHRLCLGGLGAVERFRLQWGRSRLLSMGLRYHDMHSPTTLLSDISLPWKN